MMRIVNSPFDSFLKAFGGASKFLAKVKATGIQDADLNPQVRAKLNALRKKERDEEERYSKGERRQ